VCLHWIQTLRVRTRPRRWIFKGDKNRQHTFLRKGSKAGRYHFVRFYGILMKSWSPTGMDNLNYHFLLQSLTGSRDVSGDSQSALVDKLGVSSSRSRLLTSPHLYHPGIVQQAQGRSTETAVSPHHNNQSSNLIPVQTDKSTGVAMSWSTYMTQPSVHDDITWRFAQLTFNKLHLRLSIRNETRWNKFK
jgi:hypothetical protein